MQIIKIISEPYISLFLLNKYLFHQSYYDFYFILIVENEKKALKDLMKK